MRFISSRSWRGSLLLGAAIAASFGFGTGTALAADAASSDMAPPPGKVVDRSTFTTTSESSSGEMTTRAYPEPANFKTGDGSWAPIDDTLEHASDGTVHPADVDGDATIPSSLATPLTIAHDGRTLSFRLHGGSDDPSGDRAVSGDDAVFDNALSDATVKYTARGDGLDETLVLDSAAAPHSYSYDLTADDDLTASIDADGDLVMTTPSGAEEFRVDAPIAWDSSTPVRLSDALTLSVTKESAGHWMLTMKADDAWLNNASTTYPVSLDPNFSWIDASTEQLQGATQDCYLYGGYWADEPTCSFAAMALGYKNNPARPILRFDIASAIPSNAVVSSATLNMFQPTAYASSSALTSRVYTVTSPWDNSTSWNSRTTGSTTTPWTTPGGDMSSDPTLTGTPMTGNGAGNQWYSWNVPTAAVQGWASGSLANDGLEVKADTESAAAGQYIFDSSENAQAYWPALDVVWTTPDVTPPPAPTDLELNPVDDVTQSSVLTYEQPDDAAGAAHEAVSGVTGAQVRWSVNGGAYSGWVSTAGDEFPIEPVSAGDSIAVDVRDVDDAGNVSATTSTTLSVPTQNDESPADPIEAAEFADQYSVSYDTALSWLDAQQTAADLQQEVGAGPAAASWAGMWFDNDAEKIHVQVLDSSGATAVQNTAQDLGINSFVVTDQVPYTSDHTNANYTSASQQLASQIGAGDVEVVADTIQQKVVFFVSTSASAATTSAINNVASSLTPAGTVVADDPSTHPSTYDSGSAIDYGTCAQVNEQPASGFNFLNSYCTTNMRAGVGMTPWISIPAGSIPKKHPITSPGCSSAFNVQGSDGEPYILTAGHCVDYRDPNAYPAPKSDPRHNGAPVTSMPTSWYGLGYGLIGTTASWVFKDHRGVGASTSNDPASGQGPNDYWDAAAIHYNSPPDSVYGMAYLTAHSRYNGHRQSSRFPIKGAAGTLAPGSWLCALGGRSGVHCGPFVNYGPGGESVRFAACGLIAGDSGSAVVYGHLAAGIYSRGSAMADTSADGMSKYYKTSKAAGGDAVSLGCHQLGGVPSTENFAEATSISTALSQVSTAPSGSSPGNTMSLVTDGTPWRHRGTRDADEDFERAELTWNTDADLDLDVWDSVGDHALHFGGQGEAVPGTRLSADVTSNGGPETFTEEGGATDSDYDFGVCYASLGALSAPVPTTATLKLFEPDGTVVVRTILVDQPGDFGLARADYHEPSTHGNWCHVDGQDGSESITHICPTGQMWITPYGCKDIL